jgi:two-component system CheB/CheR fusion protein
MAKAKSNKKEKEQPTHTAAPRVSKEEFLIAGLGASAGGIQAFQQFFLKVPPESGIAYVVILHMSPDHDSHLAQVLQATTKMPVTQVNEKIKVQPDNVYVVPPNRHLTMQDGHIIVSPNTQIEDRRAPVDIFFRTLAEEHNSKAIAVILSGTGANGSMGLKRVKENGGATFVQNPREAEFNEMPRNAIATGLVDEVLNVGEIPAKIIAYKNSHGRIQISEDAEKHSPEQQQALRNLFTELRLRTGHDFSNYKRPTLLRRIERRINIQNLPDLPSYVTYIHENPEETQALLKDLLISVTNFFRDKKAFEIIENELLPKLFKGKNSENQLRIWVAGCATGEEAYSFAILCAEKTDGMIDAPKVQIFATDIDGNSIAEARDGLYSINDLADVSPERLRRFFIKEGDDYRIRREVRESIMFANHNLLKDPPFSHLDLVSCRNVMIYLNHVAQQRLTETFHFALNPGGYLFLGSSESVDGASDFFASYNRENHIFQSRPATSRAYPIPESVPNFGIDKPHISVIQEQENKQLERISFGDLHQQLLEQYGPPSIVVNEEYDIVHLSERAGRFLQIGGGEPSQNLLKMVRPELRLELRSALYQAMQRQSAVEARGVEVKIDKDAEIINIHVRPVLRKGDTARGFILVLFETSTGKSNGQEISLTPDEPIARHLEEELMRVKNQLRSLKEQQEFEQEEFKASNEELQAMNEELRSAAEELETSKEELQSINEELRTVNQELNVKIEEANLTSNNLQNLINSTDIGTIFLDRRLRVSLFTPLARNIFNLIPADHGRPLTDITNKLDYHKLLHDAEMVLEKLTTLEQEVSTTDGNVFLMRIAPYRTIEDRINGVVIAFVDITARKEAETLLQQNMDELTRINQSMISRETRMIELKKEVNELSHRLGEAPPYPLKFENEKDDEDV